MSSLPPTSDKMQALDRRMQELGISAKDLEEHFIKGSGPGGQKINKTSVCVVLRHIPSGIEVRCQETRSQAMNRFFARRRLCDELEARIAGERSKKVQQREKIRRQKRKRSKRAKEKMLQGKKHRGETKAGRRKVDASRKD